ncbi:MAG: ATP-grasp domain-containing protein [Clostridiales Family XIII bacterium]|nr:ATP-grasp domain-containing protein [Clostridiales Family XIII bacterium]
MNEKIGVLVFPAGEINSIELHDALSDCVNIRLYGASSVDRHGGFVFEHYIGALPFMREEGFVESINKVISENAIDLIIPTHDDAVLFLTENQNRLNAKVLGCGAETAGICRDKKRTYELFYDCDFCPKIFTKLERFPVFAKPRKGQGGAGSRLIHSADDIPSGLGLSADGIPAGLGLSDDDIPAGLGLSADGIPSGLDLSADGIPAGLGLSADDIPAGLDPAVDDITTGLDPAEYVICEYLPGEELTVDCFTDKNGRLQAVLPRSRQRIFGGVSVRGQNEPLTSDIERIADTINSRLRFLGLWYFQIKRDSCGDFKLLEISARCAGTMCLSRALGVNLPLLSVYAAMGRETEVLKNNYKATVDRTLISRYRTDLRYESVYIDLDDTIIRGSLVNLQIIRFLYQCVNKGKHIILVTRHCTDHGDSVSEVLKRHKISSDLFDEIIELDAETPKYTVIEPRSAIFIDNAYAERKAVYKKLDIPVFDVDGVEVLLDWRT